MKNISICYISSIILMIFSIIMFISSLMFLLKMYSIFMEWLIIEVNSVEIVMTFLFDWMSLLFMSFVLFISSLVIFYSNEYMEGDSKMIRFISLVLLFVFSMMMLIISPNLISILLGWDGLGLISYCLVIYFQNVKSFNAGMLTALSNRVGDVALLIAISWMMSLGGWSFYFYLDWYSQYFDLQIVTLLVMIAAMTKSAQIPFSSWLPAAMAAPTPVSALVHSSTLVTAGVYLLIRFNIVVYLSNLSGVLLLIGGLTMFMAGWGACYEYDLKKIIALSTLSQLGLMMSILSMGFWKLAFFHLLTHALFKALLFLCAGAIIHNMGNTQDIRYMGGISIHMPMTSACMNTANLALCGMPFLAGFYSSDLILEISSLSTVNMLGYFLYFFSTGLTVAYSFRLVYFSMTGPLNKFSLLMLNDESKQMKWSMMILSFMSIIGGSMLGWMIFPSPLMICLPPSMKLLTLTCCFLGGIIGYNLSGYSLFSNLKSMKFYNLSSFLGSMWYMPYISTYGILKYPLSLGGLGYKIIDQGWSEKLGSQEMMLTFSKLSAFSVKMQLASLKPFFLTFSLWVFLLLMSLFL